MTSRGPQQREHVRVEDPSGRAVATATCFFSTWSDERSGDARWRGFLAAIEPAGAIRPGRYEIVLASGARAVVVVSELRSEPREQAVFNGVGRPPPEG